MNEKSAAMAEAIARNTMTIITIFCIIILQWRSRLMLKTPRECIVVYVRNQAWGYLIDS